MPALDGHFISCTAAAAATASAATASSLLLGFLLGEEGDRAGMALGWVVLDSGPEPWRIGRFWTTPRRGSGGTSHDDLGMSKQS